MTPLHDTRPPRSVPDRPPGAFVTAAGVPIHYVMSGAGRPAVLVHGAKGSVYDFLLSIAGEVAGRYTAVAFDRPGSGFSGRLQGDGSPQGQAAVLQEAARRLGLRRPILVGHSFGAAVCLAWALQSPDETGAVVTVGGHVLPLGGEPPRLVAYARSRLAVGALAALARTPPGEALSRRILGRIFAPDPVPPDYLRIAPRLALDRDRLADDGGQRVDWSRGLRTLQQQYPRLATPVVIVVGEQDRVVPPASSLRLHELLPHSELRVIPRAGHLPQFAHAAQVVAAIDRAAALADDDETPTATAR